MTSSYNPAVPAEYNEAVRAAIHQDVRGEDLVGETLSVVHWVTIDAESTNPETGEVQPFVRLVLIEEDGRRISFGSDWLLAGLRTLETHKGFAPWRPPLRMKVVAIRTRAARTCYGFDLV